MRVKVEPGDIARFTAFTAAMSVATDRVNDFSARLAALSSVSGTAALQIANLPSNAAHIVAMCQALATCCQCTCAAPSQKASSVSWYLETAQQVFVLGAALLAGVKIWAEAGRWLLKFSVVRMAIGGLSAAVRTAGTILQALIESEAFAALAETAGVLIAAVAAWVTSPVIVLTAEIVAAVAVVAGLAYLAWRNWSTIVRTLRTVADASSREAIAMMGKIASALAGESEDGAKEDLGPAGVTRRRRRGWVRPNGIATSVFDSAATYFADLTRFPLLRSTQSDAGSGFLQGSGSLRGAALAMLAAPLMVAPTPATIPSVRSSIDTSVGASIVINSTPTIVINSNQPDDIEQRVLEALRQHRETIFEQWSSELQRRQRTEF